MNIGRYFLCAAMLCFSACGGEEFTTGGPDVQDAAASQDVAHDQLPATDGSAGNGGHEGGVGGMGGTAGSSGTGGQGGTAGDSGTGGSLGGSAGDSGTGGTALADAGEEDAGSDVLNPPDAAEEPDVPEPDADPCPNGGIVQGGPDDCGQPPSDGLWICYVLPHLQNCGTVGAAGSNPPLGGLIDTFWNDPMIVSGGKCVAGASTDKFVLCKLLAPITTKVELAPGLHDGSGATFSGRFACDDHACRGRLHVYKDGNEVGGMQNSVPSGIVSLTPHQGRLDLTFDAP